MAHRFTFTDRVQFADTDMAGIVHFSNFFRYMERAEHAFFRSLETSIWDASPTIPDGEHVGWPRVHVSCDYRAPLYFEEEFEVELLVEEIRSKTIRYIIRFWKTGRELSAEAHLVVACVRRDPATGKMKAVIIPDRIREKIEIAPPELLAPIAK
jgi:acyl-CoA thioester hydrolase